MNSSDQLPFNDSKRYLLINSIRGPSAPLDYFNASGPADSSLVAYFGNVGIHWQFTLVSPDWHNATWYNICTTQTRGQLCLDSDVGSSEYGSLVTLGSPGYLPGETWAVLPFGDGTYGLVNNGSSDNNIYFGIDPNSDVAVMGVSAQEELGRHWTISEVANNPATTSSTVPASYVHTAAFSTGRMIGMVFGFLALIFIVLSLVGCYFKSRSNKRKARLAGVRAPTISLEDQNYKLSSAKVVDVNYKNVNPPAYVAERPGPSLAHAIDVTSDPAPAYELNRFLP